MSQLRETGRKQQISLELYTQNNSYRDEGDEFHSNVQLSDDMDNIVIQNDPEIW